MKPVSAVAAAFLLAPFAFAQQTPTPSAPAQPVLTQQAPARQPVYQTNPPIPPLPTKAQHEANFDSEMQQANALFTAGKQLDALPLYADLCRQDPTVALFAERHAAGLFAKFSAPAGDQAEKFNAFVQGMNEANRAQALGDGSQTLNVMLEWATKTPMGALITGIPLTTGYSHQPNAAALATYQQADAAFGAQKYDEAAKLFSTAAGQDPAFYMSPLYAGDSYLRLKDFASAYQWYAKAIAVDPDRETAYRYWGDALFKQGDPAAAKAKLEQAYVAEPYNNMTWFFLRQWSAATKTPLTVPRIGRPEFYLRNGKTDFDPRVMPESGDGRASWLVYQHVRVSHGAPSLVQNLPPAGATLQNGDFEAKGYIHTLAEEMDAMTALLTDVKAKLAAGTVTQEKVDPGLKLLLHLQQDNMLECFILLNAYDMGLRHDYPKYLAAHRDQLVAYVDRYLFSQPVPATAPSR